MPTRSIQPGVVVEAAVDYISATGASTLSQRRLVQIANMLRMDAIGDGGRERTWSKWGYEGVAVGPISVGNKPGSTLVRISGPRAHDFGYEVVSVADTLSRIDLQATVRFSRDVRGLARYHDREFRRYKRAGGRRLASITIDTDGEGDTFGLGSRYSNYHGRVYDKYRESGKVEYRRCWRYEVECKHDAAKKAARFLTTTGHSGAAIAGAVRDWFGARGVVACYRSTVDGSLGSISAADSDAAKSLKWLSVGVAPVVKRLARVYGMSAVLGVLADGLDPSTVLPLRMEREEELAAYDAWSIDQAETAGRLSAI